MRNDQEKVINSTKALVGELEANINALNAQQDNMVAEITAYTQPKKEAADKLVADAHALLDDAQKEVDQARKDAAATRSANDAATSAIAAERAQLELDKKALADKEAAFETTKSTFDAYQAEKMQEIKTGQEALAKTNDDLVVREGELAEGLSNLVVRKSTLEEKEGHARAEQESMDLRKLNLDEREHKLANLEKDLDTRAKALLADETAFANQKTSVDKKDGELTQLIADTTARKNEYDEMIADLKVRSAGLDAYKLTIDEQADINRGTLNQIAAKNRDLDAKIKTLQELHDSLPKETA